MPDLIFHHPNLDRDLKIQTGANQIQWAYGLNTQTMPTYGGEVVQILSAYVDDITIQGDLRTYRKLEQIYKWFLEYIQTATQSNRFDEHPVDMYYAERGWHLKIKPINLPAFREATDVTAPQYQISANVTETDPAMDAFTMDEAAKKGFDFSNITAGVGWDDDNPFTNFFAQGSKYDPQQITGRITDWYQNLIPSYLDHSFDDLFKSGFLGSKPLLDNSSKGDNKGQDNQNQTAPPIHPPGVVPPNI
jgi:hypothetical protein